MADSSSIADQNSAIAALYEALERDPSVLDKIDKDPFMETPLHTAVRVGQMHFAIKIMVLKPSWGRKLNKNGYSPMHLALMEGHDKVATELLVMDKELARVKGRERKTPLHIAVERNMYTVLGKMLQCCPNCIEDLTVHGETAFHLAVKCNCWLSFKVLMSWIPSLDKGWHFLTWKDDEGYNILHRATLSKDFEKIKVVLNGYKHFGWMGGPNDRDTKHRTALDILYDENIIAPINEFNKIESILRRGGVKRVEELDYLYVFTYPFMFMKFFSNFVLIRNIRNEHREELLVVAGLIITATFQIGVNPPGGLWQEHALKQNGTTKLEHFAGTPILATTNPKLFCGLTALNTIGFLMSFYMINELARGIPLSYLLQTALALLYLCYVGSIIAITGKTDVVMELGIIMGVSAVILIAIIILRFCIHRKIGKLKFEQST